jgi:alkylation response protein AidB-like acyl-CoA dehydrogenase
MTESIDCTKILSNITELEPLIRKYADASEQQRHLADPVVEAFKDAGIYRLITPVELGGLGADLMTFHKVVEAVSSIDGSAGWCAFINGGCPLTGAYLPTASAKAIYGEPDALCSGTVFPFGRAELAREGMHVTGRWPYASGSWHSTWHFAFCNVFEPGSDKPLADARGVPLIAVPHLPRSQVTLLDTWHVSGLAGTGSHDVEIDQFVPNEYIWNMGPSLHVGEYYQGPLFRVPFLSVFAWPIASVALGIARGALRALQAEVAGKRNAWTGRTLREQQLFQLQYAQATARTEAARSWHYSCLQSMWDRTVEGQPVTLEERATALLAATNATHEAAAAVEIAYRAGGGSANMRTSRLQRALRDVNATTQHAASALPQFPSAGAMLLGLAPENPMILL